MKGIGLKVVSFDFDNVSLFKTSLFQYFLLRARANIFGKWLTNRFYY